jgi:hypothetical protein
VNQRHAADLMRAMGNGDAAGVQRAMQGLYGGSQVIIQETVTSSTSTGFDAAVVEGKISSETSTTVRSYVKPENGTFTTVEHGAHRGGGGGSGW